MGHTGARERRLDCYEDQLGTGAENDTAEVSHTMRDLKCRAETWLHSKGSGESRRGFGPRSYKCDCVYEGDH